MGDGLVTMAIRVRASVRTCATLVGTLALPLPLSLLVPAFSPAAVAATKYVVTATVPVAHGLLGPSVAVDPTSHRAYVTSYLGNAVSVIDTGTNTLVVSIPVPHPASVAVDEIPTQLVNAWRPALLPPIFPTKPTVFVSQLGSVSVVDGSTNTVTASVSLGDNSADGLAVDPTTHTVYAVGSVASTTGKSMVTVVDGVQRTVKSTVTVTGGFFKYAAVDPSTHNLFTTGCCLNQTWVLNGPTATTMAPVTIPGGGGVAVDPATHQLYVTNGGTPGAVSVVDESTNAITTTIPADSEPAGAAVDASTNTIYVANPQSNTVSVIDGTTNQITATVPVGKGPDAVAVDPTTHTAYVANVGDNSVSVIARVITGPVTRLSGSDRFGTAVAISKTEFPNGGAGAVVPARSDDYPDALVGAPLAAAKNAPLLLTTGASLPAGTLAEIQRVLAAGKPVYVLGGPKAVPMSIDAQLTGLGYTVTRYFGDTRYATAVKVAGALGNPVTVLLATGTNFPDALSAGVAAVKAAGVVLLTNGNVLPTETATYLSTHPGTVYAVGGPASKADPLATAIVGTDRFETAVDVASKFFTSPSTIGFATGLSFPDALSGGALLGPAAGPLLLVSTSSVPTSVTNYLTLVKATALKGYLFGGPNTVTSSVADSLNLALGG
jgi:YVTN family beta-propeller protein